jgi:peroxiredoxin
VVAIACDPPADGAPLQKAVPQVTLLEDPDKTASTAWGVLPAGGDEPDAATFVVRRDGTVAFRRLADPSHDWPTYDELFAALQ